MTFIQINLCPCTFKSVVQVSLGLHHHRHGTGAENGHAYDIEKCTENAEDNAKDSASDVDKEHDTWTYDDSWDG